MSNIKQLIKKAVGWLPSSYVLMFHHITSTPEIKCSSCMLDTDRFYDIINSLSGFESLEWVLKKPYKRSIAITFDDGLEDLYTIAYPYLTSMNIPFTAFIITDFLDKPGYITTEQLIEMSKNPLVTIGSHGITHKIFTELNSEEKKKELSLSKEILENITGKSINVFAYSHGAYDKETLGYIRQHYMYGVSVRGYPLNFITKLKWEIPRLNIEDSTYVKFKNKLSKCWRRKKCHFFKK